MIYSVWLIFDGCLPGSLHVWLDLHHAKECGCHTAFFEFEVKEACADLAAALRRDLDKSVSFDCEEEDCRIYVIWQNSDGKMKGKFIRGERRKPFWYGAAYPTSKNETDDGIVPVRTSSSKIKDG